MRRASVVHAVRIGSIVASLLAAEAANGGFVLIPRVELEDQYGRRHRLGGELGVANIVVLADRPGSAQLEGWIRALHDRYGGRLPLHGIARLAGVPSVARPLVRALFRSEVPHPVLLDWTGEIAEQLAFTPGRANVLLVDREGRIRHRWEGGATPEKLAGCFREIDALLIANEAPPPPEAPDPPPPVRPSLAGSPAV